MENNILENLEGCYGGGSGDAGGSVGGDDEETLMLEDGSGSSDRKKTADRVKGPWARDWSLIARGIPGRSGKSCRLRWCNQLDPAVKRKPFSGYTFWRKKK